MHRHADAELLTLLTTTAPPADLNKVSMYAAHLKKYREEAPLDQMLIFPIDLPNSAAFPISGRAPPGIKRQAREGGGASWQNAFI